MSPEEGYRLAHYQRPGVKIVMGVTEAREERIPARALLYGKAFGDGRNATPVLDSATSWFEFDCARLVGATRLSWWATYMLGTVYTLSGRMPTAKEVAFFSAKDTSRAAANAYLQRLRQKVSEHA